MSTGQSLLLSSVLFVDTELGSPIVNYNRITDFCITDVFGSTLLHSNTICKDDVQNISDLVSGKVVLAFDSNQDATFLSRELEFLKLDAISIKWFCAKKFLECALNTSNLSLKKACFISRLKYPKHDAVSDCIALARVFRKVFKNMSEVYSQQYVNLVLAILEASKEAGMDNLPVGDNLPLDYLMKEIEGRTTLGTQYLEIFRNEALDELTRRGAFATNVDLLKRNDDLNNVT